MRVVIERSHARTESVSREREQAAARSYIEEGRSAESLDSEQPAQRRDRLLDLLLVDDPQKVAPVLSELESLSASDFERVLVELVRRGDLTGPVSPMN